MAEKLRQIDGLEYLNTSEVTDMFGMFGSCSKLTTLDLSGFDTHKVTDMTAMFTICSELTTIICGDGWNTDQVTKSDYMFSHCPKLVGGKGTTFSDSHVDKAYARVDGGTENPGYLTKKVMKGDANGDVKVDIVDVTTIIDMILKSK